MNTWYSFDFSDKRLPGEDDIWAAIADVCESMLRGPISNLGVRGIRRAANAVADWPRQLDEDQLRETAFNGYIFIDAEGGTGGGMFRYMYSRFLIEAAEICGCAQLVDISKDLVGVGDDWQDIARTFKQSAVADPSLLQGLRDPLLAVADKEEMIWKALDTLQANPAA
jgi:hypothetical protein